MSSGYCEDDTNTAECNYDGGDCCGSNVNTYVCSDCICYPHETCDGPLELISDGYCNDATNNAGCNFDGGDCILHCNGPLDLISNGYCNDETNNVDCNFDGGDCCGGCANTEHCSNCICHPESPIVPFCHGNSD